MRTVPPIGSLNSKIAIVGEAPANEEIYQGIPFVGRAGQQLNSLLIQAIINRQELYITNLFKFEVSKPVKGKEIIAYGQIYLFEGNKFTPEGLDFANELLAELKKGTFNVIVPLGTAATCAVLGGMRAGITKLRGSILWSTSLNKKVIPTIHPAAILREYMYKHSIIIDLQKVREEAEFPELRLPQRNYLLEPSFLEVVNYLKFIKESKLRRVSFDIELVSYEVSCISFAHEPNTSMSIPFIKDGRPYFDPDQETEVWLLIASILEDQRIVKYGQNLAFDSSVLYDKLGIVVKNIADTMIGQKLTYPGLPAGLDYITSVRTREPYYKDEGKSYMKIGGIERDFWLYNAKDSAVVAEAAPLILKDVRQLGNSETMRMHERLIEPCILMGNRGIKVDIEGLKKAKVEAEEKRELFKEELNKLVGFPINPNSTDQVAEYFYVKKKVTPYKNRKTGAITTDEGALKRIARKGFDEARLILAIRHQTKLISTYFDIAYKDGRFCCFYSPITEMGRLSSSKDLFGFGTNSQNQPKELNKFFIRDEGYLIYSVDLAQADNRSVAYIAPENTMIYTFEQGLDPHAKTASLIYGIPMDEIIAMDAEQVKAPTGYGDQTHRYWGKKCNHALNYGMGNKLFSFMLEISESEGQILWDSYHRSYPGIQQSFHTWVKAKLYKSRRLTNFFGRSYFFLDRWDDQLFNTAYAFIPQSHTSDIINRWGIIPFYYDPMYSKGILLRQVHDSIDFEVPISAGLAEHVKIVKSLNNMLTQKLFWHPYEFSIPAEFKVSDKNLKDMKKLSFNKDLSEQLSEYFKKEAL